MGMGMRPFERFWFNLHRHNTRLRKDRQIHKIERALLIWPAHVFARWKQRRTPDNPSTEGFFNAQTRGDHEWL